MGNQPSGFTKKPSKSTSIVKSVFTPQPEVNTMYKVTEECKRCKEDNIELEERIRKLNINVTNCDREKKKM